jgi:putative SOS response-associated peptidase YedK
MCGRFVISYTYDELVAMLDSDFDNLLISEVPNIPNYNVAPTTNIPVLIKKDVNIHLKSFQWGYKPFENFKNSIINVRSETMNEKPIFKNSVQKNRCIIIASGFYEWDRSKHAKQPYYIKPKKDKLMLFAGIYTKPSNVTYGETCAIITMKANSTINVIHDRMPIILAKNQINEWLDQGIYQGNTVNESQITVYPVTMKVNSVKNNHKSNIVKQEQAPTLFTI